ncbi:uncharacterized protein [Macrobrachium rosenbergii]|uniref:uncharacterized protein isoform X3 n=1 Tax=Macrobrachium rosenbergii TaxID=79674 RepID=UPI0034D6B0F5
MASEKANASRTCGLTKRIVDCVVWAKLDDELYWPGKIKYGAYIFKNGCDQQLVYVFGKRKSLWVAKNNIMPYLKYKTLFKRVNSMTQLLKFRGRDEKKHVAAMCDVEDYITNHGNLEECLERPTFVSESASYMVMTLSCGHPVLQETSKASLDVEVKVIPGHQAPSGFKIRECSVVLKDICKKELNCTKAQNTSYVLGDVSKKKCKRLKLRDCSVIMEDIFSSSPRNYARLFSMLRLNRSVFSTIPNHSDVYNVMSSIMLSGGCCSQPNVPERQVPVMPKSFECEMFSSQSAPIPRSQELLTPKLEDSHQSFMLQDSPMFPSLSSQTPTLCHCQMHRFQGSEAPNILSSETLMPQASQTLKWQGSESPRLQDSETPTLQSSQTLEICNNFSPPAVKLPETQSVTSQDSQTPMVQASKTAKILSPQTPKLPRSKSLKPSVSPVYKLRQCSVVLNDVMKAKTKNVQLLWKNNYYATAKISHSEKTQDCSEKENILSTMKSLFNASEVPVKIARDVRKRIKKASRYKKKKGRNWRRRMTRATSYDQVFTSVSSDVSQAFDDVAVLPGLEMRRNDKNASETEGEVVHETNENGSQDKNCGTDNSCCVNDEKADKTTLQEGHLCHNSVEQSELRCLSAYLGLNPDVIKCECPEGDSSNKQADESTARSRQNGHLLDAECENRLCKLEQLTDSSLTEALFSTDLNEQDGLVSSLSVEPHFLQSDLSPNNFSESQENSESDDTLDLDGVVVVKNEKESHLVLGEENDENDTRHYPLTNESSVSVILG